MTLANLLSNIADTEGSTREQLNSEFMDRISGHNEQKLLLKCLSEAWNGHKCVNLGRNLLPPPEELRKEGFYLAKENGNYIYCFD